jgi:hypothetical protein
LYVYPRPFFSRPQQPHIQLFSDSLLSLSDNGPEATGHLKAFIGDHYCYSDKPVFKALWDSYTKCQFVEDEGLSSFPSHFAIVFYLFFFFVIVIFR